MTLRRPIHILYMEDDPGAARHFQQSLEGEGYAVTLARDGKEGLEMFEAGAYDVVALGYHMPGTDGLEVIRRLAARKPLPPAIIVTGHRNVEVAVEAMKLGAVEYIIKDTDGRYLELLPAAIERALLQHRLEAEKKGRGRNIARSTRPSSISPPTFTATFNVWLRRVGKYWGPTAHCTEGSWTDGSIRQTAGRPSATIILPRPGLGTFAMTWSNGEVKTALSSSAICRPHPMRAPTRTWLQMGLRLT